ncbi:MAG: asparagine synthase (glutamine-hydrolyzing) [Kiloniellaceae bacterium]
MCGIAGLIDPTGRLGAEGLRAAAARMAETLRHRGPDDGGVWIDARAGVAFGHRRLSIIDLTPAGHQPMASHDGRYVITYNGEIYNFRELRAGLEERGHRFGGHSDTEVLVAAVVEWGVTEALKRCNGMFAFALWDRAERALYLARDRLGEKPLYFGWADGAFLFGSELKALRAWPGFAPAIDRGALALYLRHNAVPAPFSIYRGLYKLPPACVLRITPDMCAEAPGIEDLEGRFEPYWSARRAAESGLAAPFGGAESEAVHALDACLREAVASRMVADVPLGAFLSGGVDSSTVVALMQAQSTRLVRTFSIGFHEAGYDEAVHAKAVARHLGTDHTELYVTPGQAMDVIPRLPALYDEPFADSSQIPTFLVSQLARRHVTVSLSGDGGDELFGGYNRYVWTRNIWRKTGWMPHVVRRAAAELLTRVPPRRWDRMFAAVDPVLPMHLRHRLPGDKMHKLATVLALDGPETLYRFLVSHWRDPSRVVDGADEPATVLTDRRRWADVGDLTQRMMFFDLVSYLPDDILVKVDRASMGVGLEARVPLLDHRVVEFAWRLPMSLKVRDGQGKWALRQVLHRYVPREPIERPKMGFGVPIDSWLRRPLRDWAEALLDETRLRREGFFDPEPIRRLWSEHLSGQRNWQYHLWDVLMFQAWHEAQRHDSASSERSSHAVAHH